MRIKMPAAYVSERVNGVRKNNLAIRELAVFYLTIVITDLSFSPAKLA